MCLFSFLTLQMMYLYAAEQKSALPYITAADQHRPHPWLSPAGYRFLTLAEWHFMATRCLCPSPVVTSLNGQRDAR